MNIDEPRILRTLVWLGDSRKVARAFPQRVRKLVGDELQLIQFGGMPKDAKPLRGIGRGVIEIAVRFNKEAYRTVLAVQLGSKVYVLHAFQKKSKSGIKTPQFDIELVKQRYKVAEELSKDDEA